MNDEIKEKLWPELSDKYQEAKRLVFDTKELIETYEKTKDIRLIPIIIPDMLLVLDYIIKTNGLEKE